MPGIDDGAVNPADFRVLEPNLATPAPAQHSQGTVKLDLLSIAGPADDSQLDHRSRSRKRR